MKRLKSILEYAMPYKGYMLLNIICNLFSVVFSLFSLTMIIPFLDLIFLKSTEDYVRNITEKPTTELSIESLQDNFNYYFSEQIVSDPIGGKIDALIFLCILIITMIFFKNLFRYLAMFYIAQVRNGIMKDLRDQLNAKILRLPLSYYSEERKGDIISRMTGDVQEIEWTVMTSIEVIFKDPASLLIFLGAMLFMSPQLTIFVFILLPISGFIIGRIGKSLKRTSQEGQARMGHLVSIIEETLSGLRIIKAFNAEERANEKFRLLNTTYKNLMIKMYRKRDLSSPLSEFLGVSVLVVVIWFGGRLVLSEDQDITASIFIAYIAIFSQLIPPAKSFTTAYYNIQKGSASIERIKEVLQAKETIQEKPDAKAVSEFKDAVIYKEVFFKYNTEEVLKNVNLKIPKGNTVALVGSSGSGKSTLADLLPRFYDPVEGEIQIDGIPLTDYKITDLRHLMGIVTQESILFNDSVKNNILLGNPDANDEEVINAAKIANAHEFIIQMENGYDTNIGDRGSKLSGGQRQRLSIARAILKNPPILILDEATSSLDTESEQLVQEALTKLMKNRTSLVIAHRLSTIQNADNIVVLEDGEIKEEGTHQDLLQKGGVYKKLYDLQSFE